jgi:teichoic acid transport system permease protein
MYSIEVFIHKHDAHPWIDWLLTVNPAAVYIELMRGAFGATTWPSWAAPPMTWVYGVVWAVVASFFGFVFFWRAESKYGRG